VPPSRVQERQRFGGTEGRRAHERVTARRSAADADSESSLTYTEAVRQAVGHLECPVLMDVDVGHRAPQMTLVQGAIARVTWSTTEKGVVRQQLT
jgi:muramoyltetrapeptide carboxypeptidase LdcA involved in peptidoglycan recycling